MTDERRVLVVDGHLDMLDFLRSVLELTVENCQVVGVSTAGDGAAALKSSTFNLMIADLGLPGMTGEGLIHHTKRLWPDMELILISDDDSDQNRKEAEKLEAYRFYSKPLDTDDLIYSVYNLLHDPEASEQEAQPGELPRIEKKVRQESPELQARLEALRIDTGARQALLANLSGDVLIATKKTGEIDLLDKVDSVADNVRASVQLGLKLGNKNPYSIQYLSGEEYEVYTANLKPDHWLALLFGIQEQRGKMGTIWLFTQKAIPDLEVLIEELEPSDEKIDDDTQTDSADRAADELPFLENEDPDDERAISESEEEQAAAVSEVLPEEVASEEELDAADLGEEQALVKTREEIEHIPADHLVSIEDDEAEEKDELDLFWEDAQNDSSDTGDAKSGISYEEALRLGLVPGDVELPEDDLEE